MIKNVFYTDNMTYIKDDKDREITTLNLSFSQAFHFARVNDVEFDYDTISKDDEEDFSYYLQYKVGDCKNTNISYFFKLLEENGIRKIINNIDLFGRKGVRQTISKIINDYNSDVALYNIECYGTDTYIAKVLYNHLMIYNSDIPQKDSRVYTLLKLVDCDDYDLDVFLDILHQLSTQDKNDKIIEKWEKDFIERYNHTSEAIEWFIEPIVTYGGDSSHKIYKAMIEVIDDIKNGKPFCDRKGLIEYLKEQE